MTRDQLRKLRRMSRAEVRARLQAVATLGCEAARHALGADKAPDVAVPPDGDRFGGLWIDRDEQRRVAAALRASEGPYVAEVVRAADAICRHEFSLFGREVACGETVAWQADPVSGRPWPRVFHSRVRIFSGDAGHGDVKYVWELNRHQWLPVLGKAYRLTGDETYARAGLQLVDSWMADNPYRVGINWASALEVAIRALSWCWAYSLFEGSAALTPARRAAILGSLAQHGQYIERHLSLYFSPYNHLIGEAAALFVLGSLFPQLPRAARWRDRGWAILDREAPKQFHPDGGSVEQATGYHHFTLGFYLQAVLVRVRQGGPLGHAWSGLERALEFSMYMTRPDGSTPMIGDADEGKALELAQPHLWDFRSFLAIGAVLFSRGDLKRVSGMYPADAAWLLGTSGRARYDSLGETAPGHTSRALSQSGYYVMRTSWDRDAHVLALDCGELSAGVCADDTTSAAHGHADALSIEVAAYGDPLLVDPGFLTYNGDLEWHRYFRDTQAHNTVVVDGASQAEFRGRLKWSHGPRVEPHEWLTLGALEYADGSHFGYQRLASPVIHRRAVLFFKPDYWVVRDELLGGAAHTLDRYFHFATSEVVQGLSNSVLTQRGTQPNLAVIPVEGHAAALDLTKDGTAPGAGWLAVGYERKARAAVARYRTISSLPCALHTVIAPFRGTTPAFEVDPGHIESDGRSALARSFVVSRQGRRDVWAFAGGHRATFEKRWVTDAHSTCVSVDDTGAVLACVFVSGSRVDVDGKPLLWLDRRVRGAALYLSGGRPVLALSQPARIQACLFSPASIVVCSDLARAPEPQSSGRGPVRVHRASRRETWA